MSGSFDSLAGANTYTLGLEQESFLQLDGWPRHGCACV